MSGKDNFIYFYLIFKTLCFVSARVVQFILASVLACNLNSNIQFFLINHSKCTSKPYHVYNTNKIDLSRSL